MKKVLFLTVIVTVFISCKQKKSAGNEQFYGRWNTTFKNGNKVLAVFRKDGTHDYFINGKLFSNGKFTLEGNTLSEADPICNGNYYATYTVKHLSDNEMQFTVIQDTCQPRVHDLDGIKMTREK